MRELTEKDFAKGVKNPHFEKRRIRVEIDIKEDDWDTFRDLGARNYMFAETIMSNCLSDFAKKIREGDC